MGLLIYMITVTVAVLGIFILNEEKDFLNRHKILIPVIIILVAAAVYYNLVILTGITRVR